MCVPLFVPLSPLAAQPVDCVRLAACAAGFVPLWAGPGRPTGRPPGPAAAPRLPAVGRACAALANPALVAGVDAAHATTLQS